MPQFLSVYDYYENENIFLFISHSSMDHLIAKRVPGLNPINCFSGLSPLKKNAETNTSCKITCFDVHFVTLTTVSIDHYFGIHAEEA